MELKEIKEMLPEKLLVDLEEQTKGVAEAKKKKIYEQVYKKYTEALVEAGESVGLVGAQSIGEPGTQMSIDYEEKVIVRSRNRIKIVKIGELIDKMMDVLPKQKQNGTEVCDLSDKEIFVPALSQNEKIEWKKAIAISRHKAPKKLLKLTTRSGRTITSTPYHSFVIRKNNRVIAVEGSSLKIGDRIPSVKNILFSENKFIEMENYLPKRDYIYESELRKAINKQGNFVLPIKSYEQINNYAQENNKIQLQQNCIYAYQVHSKSMIPEVVKLDALWGFFIGAYLAEGTHTKNYVTITNISQEFQRQIVDFADKYNIEYKIKYEIGEFGQSTSLILNSTLIADFLSRTCGKGALNKFVPEFAYNAPPEFTSALLRAYFDGDGNISVERKVIRASSCSKELIDGIALLLSRFGIFAIKSKNKNQHTLSIPGKYARIFEEKIGLTIPRKKERLKELASIEGPDKNDIIDMIPNFGEIFSEIGKKLSLPSINKFTKKQKIGRQTLNNYIAVFEQKAKQKNINMEKELKLLKQMAYSDVVWDEITKIEYVSPTREHVYDFSVEDHETFTTFEGIVTHNTLNTFHFAGVSEMNVTVGLPRLIEILDARQDVKTPMMEIYFKKNVSGSVESVRKMALKIKESYLGEVVQEISLDMADKSISVVLDKEKMKNLDITQGQIVSAFKKTKINIKETDNGFVIKTKKEDLNEVYRLKEKIKDVPIKGIKGIKQVLPVKRGDEYVVITAGSNLKEVFQLEDVDTKRTISNDILEINEVLGVEAARQAIVDEAFKVIESQGLNVDIRHIMLVADTMCSSGTVKGITRYGVVSEKASVLAKASFETPIKHIINAALIGEVDKLDSVVENVMLNQPVPIGTGLPSLVMKKPEKK